MDLIGALSSVNKAAGVISNPWDISNATFNGTQVNFFGVSAQDATPQDVFFKSDGTKMYVLGTITDAVHEYDLSSAWDVSTASYLQSFSVALDESSPRSLFFKSDGTKMYVTGISGDDVNEYNLSSAWDVSTASYSQNFSVSSQETEPTGLFFKSDGTKMYITGSSGDDVNEYDLSSAWDVSTASYLQSFSVSTQDTSPQGIFFKADGTKMYVIGSSGDGVNEYDLSSAWDISTSSYLQNFSIAAQDTTPTGVFFKPDGTKMYVVGDFRNNVNKYDLSSAWDISTASFTYPTTDYFSVESQDTGPSGVFFKSDGTKMYVVGGTGDAIYEYDLSSAWDISSASFLQNFSVASQEANPQEVFFKPDGTKMYVIGSTGDAVYEYDLSSAWDISSASFLQNFSVASQETGPNGVFFKPDGTKMYIVGSSGDDVNEYDLSSAWDISSASFLQNFSVASQETGPTGVFFKPDGTKMYVVGSTGDAVNEYDLSSAWDISTASYLQNFSISAQEAIITGIFFKPDGTKMYIVGSSGDAVISYDL